MSHAPQTEHHSPQPVHGNAAGEHCNLLATMPAERGNRHLALAVVLLSLLAFSVSAPFAKRPLPAIPAFVPVYQSVVIVNDLITAVLLYGQFHIARSRALLVLASAYLFTAALATAHLLTFPGLLTPTGFLGAGVQTTAWLYMFWHAGFPLFVLLYAWRKRDENIAPSAAREVHASITMIAVLVASAGLTAIATAGHNWLPPIMNGATYASTMIFVVASICGLTMVAILAVLLGRPRTVLDLWLAAVLCVWLLDIALSAGLNSGRFDLGFYAGRIYGLLATSFVLVMLLFENNRLYALLIESQRSEQAKAFELHRLSMLDPLTGLANRRAFDATLDQEWRRSMRHHTALSLVMIDVDCFKRFNDTYGHIAGDECLRAVGRVLANNARRAGDLAARYGGEEFALVLPNCTADDARRSAERICLEVRQLGISHANSIAADHVTISAGVASAHELYSRESQGSDAEMIELRYRPDLLVARADKALYAAKEAGRNQVAVASVALPVCSHGNASAA